MKKVILTFSTILFLMFLTASAFAQVTKGNSLVGRANAAAALCINDYRGRGMDIKPVVETTGICFVASELHKVSFYAVQKCRTNPCPRTLPKLVASVYFDCDDNIMSVECAK